MFLRLHSGRKHEEYACFEAVGAGKAIPRKPTLSELLKDDISEELICLICSHVFEKPVVVSPCGDVFCRKCIEEQFSSGNYNCMDCGQTLEVGAIITSRFVEKKLNCLEMYCENGVSYSQLQKKFTIHGWRREGCQEVVKRGNYGSHLKTCAFTLAACPNEIHGCPTVLEREDLARHIPVCKFKPLSVTHPIQQRHLAQGEEEGQPMQKLKESNDCNQQAQLAEITAGSDDIIASSPAMAKSELSSEAAMKSTEAFMDSNLIARGGFGSITEAADNTAEISMHLSAHDTAVDSSTDVSKSIVHKKPPIPDFSDQKMFGRSHTEPSSSSSQKNPETSGKPTGNWLGFMRKLSLTRFRKRAMAPEVRQKRILQANLSKEYGEQLVSNGSYTLAFEVFAEALDFLPTGSPERSDCHAKRAFCLMHFNPPQFKEAIRECDISLSLQPELPFPLLLRAKSYQALGIRFLAFDDLTLLLKIDPQNSEALSLKSVLEKAILYGKSAEN